MKKLLARPEKVAALALVVGALVHGQLSPSLSSISASSRMDNAEVRLEALRMQERRAVLYGFGSAAVVFGLLYLPRRRDMDA